MSDENYRIKFWRVSDNNEDRRCDWAWLTFFISSKTPDFLLRHEIDSVGNVQQTIFGVLKFIDVEHNCTKKQKCEIPISIGKKNYTITNNCIQFSSGKIPNLYYQRPFHGCRVNCNCSWNCYQWWWVRSNPLFPGRNRRTCCILGNNEQCSAWRFGGSDRSYLSL